MLAFFLGVIAQLSRKDVVYFFQSRSFRSEVKRGAHKNILKRFNP